MSEWLRGHADFRKHMEAKLCPSIEEIDFGYELSRKIELETKEFLA